MRRIFFFFDFFRYCKVEPDCGAVKNDSLSVMAIIQEMENPFQEKRRNIRKNISKVMDFEKLTPETKLAYQQERERKKQYVRRLQRVRLKLKKKNRPYSCNLLVKLTMISKKNVTFFD